MTNKDKLGADAVVEALRDNGVECVFGVPGSSNIALFDALDRSNLRTVLAVNETTAGFMANGWYRASGRPGVFLAMLGPGFAYAFPPLAEAALDSSAVMLITGTQIARGRMFDLQSIDQNSVARAICRHVYEVGDVNEVREITNRAISDTSSRGAEPVVLQISSDVLQNTSFEKRDDQTNKRAQSTDEFSIPEDLAQQLLTCQKPVLFVGSGALAYSTEVAMFASNINALVSTTPSARGIIPENEWRVLAVDFLSDDTAAYNRLIEESDLIIALGCRFSHNGSGGYAIRLPEEKFLHVHENASILNTNYKGRWTLSANIGDFISIANEVVANKEKSIVDEGWDESAARKWSATVLDRSVDHRFEPEWAESPMSGCHSLFEQIRSGMPDNAILVTDTGTHQILARKYFEVRAPRGLIIPGDFQSMGFGLPAAIGAALAAPERPVVALIGDGSFMMTATELLTVVRENIPLVVIVFHDGWLSQIRMQQVANGQKEFATKLQTPNIKSFVESMGINYVLGGSDIGQKLTSCLSERQSVVFEIRLNDPPGLKRVKIISSAKNKVRRVLGGRGVRLAKKLAGRSDAQG